MQIIHLRPSALSPSWFQPVVNLWNEWREDRRTRLEMDALSRLDSATLRDIGVCDWMVESVAARRDALELRIYEQQQGGQSIDRLRGLK